MNLLGQSSVSQGKVWARWRKDILKYIDTSFVQLWYPVEEVPSLPAAHISAHPKPVGHFVSLASVSVTAVTSPRESRHTGVSFRLVPVQTWETQAPQHFAIIFFGINCSRVGRWRWQWTMRREWPHRSETEYLIKVYGGMMMSTTGWGFPAQKNSSIRYLQIVFLEGC